MPIKVGFSTSVCPEWDIHQIATQANEMGFYGVELGTVRDELHLPVAEDLQSDRDIDAVRKLFEQNSVELVGLASIYSLESPKRHIREHSISRTIENIELASKLGCPFVRVPVAQGVEDEPADRTLARTIAPLTELSRIAARNQVKLLICNTPDFPDSRAIWFVVDGVSHASVRAAWNPVFSMIVNDSATLAVKRLGARIRMTIATDAALDEDGLFDGFRPVGEGCLDCALTIDLLKGIVFDGYLMLDWPQARLEKFPPPEEALPAARDHLLERIKHQDPVLTAYKKDSNAPNLSNTPKAYVERKVAGGAVAEAEAETGEESKADSGSADKPRVPKGGDPEIARKVAEAVARVRAARKSKGD